MRRTLFQAVTAALLFVTAGPALAAWTNLYEVRGVEKDDMLKLRAGRGTGYVVLLGLPNGTLVRIMNCQMVGGTNWCKVHLNQAPAWMGYVSDQYLREKR